MFRKIPLAWLQLKHERVRLLVAISGITFAVILIFMQLGFQAALFDSAVRIQKSLRGDIFLISTRSTSLIAMKSFSWRHLYQALSFKEVKFITPLYLGFAQWKNPVNPTIWHNIHIIGFDIGYSIFDLPDVENNLSQLQKQDVILFDRASRTEFGPITQLLTRETSFKTDLDNITSGTRQVEVIGSFQLGTSFGIDGNIITSQTNFLRIFSQRRQGLIEVGLVKLKPHSNSQQIKVAMQGYLPSDIRVFTKQEWIDFEKNYWMNSTAIGFIFTLGVGMGLIVGVVVVYQILYTDVASRLKEYATLNAMGYKHQYFITVVFQESLILAMMGYIPGFIIASFLYNLARNSTLLPIAMTKYRIYLVFGLTIIMCFGAGVIAVKKLKDVDPADIF